MTLNDPLANAMSMIATYDQLGKKEVHLKPVSKLLKAVLDVLHKEGYIGSYEEVDEGNGKAITLQLLGRINKCGVIKPRFAVQVKDFQKFEERFLIAKNFGVLLLSTSQGIMTHKQAREKNIGGKIIAYCY